MAECYFRGVYMCVEMTKDVSKRAGKDLWYGDNREESCSICNQGLRVPYVQKREYENTE